MIYVVLLTIFIGALWCLMSLKCTEIRHQNTLLKVSTTSKVVETPFWISSILDRLLVHEKKGTGRLDAEITNFLSESVSRVGIIQEVSTKFHCGIASPKVVFIDSISSDNTLDTKLVAHYSGNAEFSIRGIITLLPRLSVPFEVQISEVKLSTGIGIRALAEPMSDMTSKFVFGASLLAMPSFSLKITSSVGGRYGVTNNMLLHHCFKQIILWGCRRSILPKEQSFEYSLPNLPPASE
ncbi:hypothetical protein XU18_2963 [Perkinsela sp. CCAP 1560/4]|nr:hypothetical protein XU18_2963 [Perkinsela sp. CCAP 1560/4]|eukprot:KNH06207.1 hypothetical protein XU18_2963 [Perkinsela sp. CCAP 1560/4]